MLDKLPPQVLEHIAFYASTTHFLGPPSSLPSLLLCNHAIFDLLNLETNPHLYARIYLFKFDTSATIRRLKRKSASVPGAADDLTATTYAQDLRRRFQILHQIKARKGTSQEDSSGESPSDSDNAYSILWLAYLMLIENDGKNLIQLTRYARMERWLNDYWFGYNSWGGFSAYLDDERWPRETLESTLAMWVLWLLLDPRKWIEDSELDKKLQLTLKTFVLSAHKYPLCRPGWRFFYPPEVMSSRNSSTTEDSLDAIETIQQAAERSATSPFVNSRSFPPIPHISKPSATIRNITPSPQIFSSPPPSPHPLHLFPAPIAVPATLIHSAIIEHRDVRRKALDPNILDYIHLRIQSLDESGVSNAIRFSNFQPDIENTSITLANGTTDSETIYTPILDRPIQPHTPSNPDRWFKEPKPPFPEDYSELEKDDIPRIAWLKSSDAASNPELAPSVKWDYEWRRMLSLASVHFPDDAGKGSDSGFSNNPGMTLKPGSVEGIWEGTFGYAEFTSYTALLSGAPPQTAAWSIEANHRQTWKLREYHLLSPIQPSTPSVSAKGSSSSDFACAPDHGPQDVRIPAAGNPLLGYLSSGAVVLERSGSDGEMVLEVQELTQQTEQRRGVVVGSSGMASNSVLSEPIIYNRVDVPYKDSEDTKGKGKADDGLEGRWEAEEKYAERVKDIIVIGEGHSAWGQFQLLGRVRPCDGLINVYKTYNDGIRGNWLYRGYLIGTGEEGNIVGRWRDTLSPTDVHGYEGRFTLTRRQNPDGI